MKVYSYMQARRCIVATGIPTHTQVLDSSTALLTSATPEAYAEALVQASLDPVLRARLGAAAEEKCEREYSLPAFQRAVDEVCAHLAALTART